jgi:hypothetical protein
MPISFSDLIKTRFGVYYTAKATPRKEHFLQVKRFLVLTKFLPQGVDSVLIWLCRDI